MDNSLVCRNFTSLYMDLVHISVLRRTNLQ